MAKYLIRASYTQEGLQGLLKDGGTKRRAVVEKMAKGLGGTLESFYYAFGEDDLVSIMDMPDNVTAAAASLMVTAAGGATTSITVLLTPEEVDQAAHKSVAYTAPGQ